MVVGKSALRLAYVTGFESQTMAVCMLERLKIQLPFSPLGLGSLSLPLKVEALETPQYSVPAGRLENLGSDVREK